MVKESPRPNPYRGVLHVVLAYSAFAALWILFSDWVIASLFSNPTVLIQVSIVKGWVFVAVTALLLYGLLRRLVAQLLAAMQRERDMQVEKDRASQRLTAIAKTTEEVIRQRHEELEALMESLPTPVFIAHDPACHQITGNLAANNLFGVPSGTNVSASKKEAAQGVRYRVFEAHGKRELSPDELPMQCAARLAQPVVGIELYITLTDGRNHWLLGSAVPLFDARGEVRGAVGIFTDITGNKEAQRALESHRDQLEEAVAARTAELLQVNERLKAFTYAASHDLKAPLRGIGSFSALLERSCRDRLESDELRFLDHIRNSTTRMTHLIDDLLAYAQQEQQALVIQPLDLGAAVRTVLDEYEEEIRRGSVQLGIDLPALRVQADPSGFAQVLRNLIGNALKYAARADPPTLEIGAETFGELCRLWVRDNGIGFDMAHHEKIFEIFSRLHAQHEIPGSGVGLALVRKAVERMRGRVWAESEPGQGATFFLELPLTPSDGDKTP